MLLYFEIIGGTMTNRFDYESGFKAGVADFQNGEQENVNHLAEETSAEYAEGYWAGWQKEKEKYEAKLVLPFL